jgi:rubrerythrin
MKFRCKYCRHEADGDVPITRCPACREIVPADVVSYQARAYPL